MEKQMLKLPDGFREEDLHQLDYARPLAEASARIAEINARLIAKIDAPDFNPAIDLDRSRNGGTEANHDFFEAIALYEEGRVPWFCTAEMCESTEQLHAKLMALGDAPVKELDASAVSFRLVKALVEKRLREPRCPRKAYLKRLFGHETRVNAALDALHGAYVDRGVAAAQNAKAAKPAKRRSRRGAGKVQKGPSIAQENRKRVLAEIARLLDANKRLSVIGAIRHLRLRGTYATYLGAVTDESWRTYYVNSRRKIPSAISWTKGGKKTSQGGKKTGQGGKKTEGHILDLLVQNPKATFAEIVEAIGISRSAIQKHIERLKGTQRLRRIGPDKGGRWEVIAQSGDTPRKSLASKSDERQ